MVYLSDPTIRTKRTCLNRCVRRLSQDCCIVIVLCQALAQENLQALGANGGVGHSRSELLFGLNVLSYQTSWG